MVDHKFGWEERVDAFGIAAHLHKSFAHGGQIHNRRHAREVLEQHARRHEGNFFFGGAWLPARQGLNILRTNEATVFAAKQVFKKDAEREGEFCQFREALIFEEFEAVNFESLGADVEFIACAEGIPCVDGHPCDPFALESSFL